MSRKDTPASGGLENSRGGKQFASHDLVTCLKSALVIDDDPSITRALALVLQQTGWNVTAANSAAEATRVLCETLFDLVITDLRLSRGAATEGLELISLVKTNTPGTCVVLMTGNGSRVIQDEAFRRGAADCWSKSIPIEQLVSKIRRIADSL